MSYYSSEITLVKNKRGCYDLDTSKGCSSGMRLNKNGCYGDCYASRSAKRYGYNFNKTVLRGFYSREYIGNIVSKINRIEMPFIRIGVTGDPSENWEHTLGIINKIKYSNKAIVIVTKHWNNLTTKQLNQLSHINNICVNTSISALDNKQLRRNRIMQYNRLKYYCMSVLRIVSCDFNIDNKIGNKLDQIQNKLFNNDNTLDTVLRVSKDNPYLTSSIINVVTIYFLKKKSLISLNNPNTFIGHCSKCPEMCGINFFDKKQNQLTLF